MPPCPHHVIMSYRDRLVFVNATNFDEISLAFIFRPENSLAFIFRSENSLAFIFRPDG